MKAYLRIVCVMLTLCSCEAKKTTTTDSNSVEISESNYDSTLAMELGADDWGMKTYVMAILTNGPIRSQDSLESVRLQRAHLDNINRLASEGKLVLAGPFLDPNHSWRGLYVFDVEDTASARKLVETDPAIQNGRLKMELHPWYGTATLGLINEWHQKISREKI
jgi:uncharacterized protein YciI